MKAARTINILWLLAALVCLLGRHAQAQILTNGGFESGLTGWTVVNQAGGDGTFFVQSGTLSPVNGFPVPAPPQGTQAAMSDGQGPGSHVLYQDFVVPVSVTSASISFSLFINNGADRFVSPASLDFATPALNQQVRVDILRASSDPFSVAAGDVLQNLYQTNPGDPLVSGYTSILSDVTTLLQANAGLTLRLRFAEVDNVFTQNLGVDQVAVAVTGTGGAAPEPSSLLLGGSAALFFGINVMRRRKFLSGAFMQES